MKKIWASINKFITGPIPSNATNKDKIRLLAMNGFAMMILLICIAYATLFSFMREYELLKIISFLSFICVVPLVLNFFGFYKFSRIYYTFQGSFFVLVYALSLDKGVGINYFFILLFVFPFVFLKPEEKIATIIFFFYNFACIIYFEFAENTLVEPIHLEADTHQMVKILVFGVLFLYLLVLFILFHQIIVKNEQQLVQTNTELKKASQIKQDFLAIMSHELRTPLNAVISITNLLSEQPEHKDREHFMQILQFSGNNLLSIINDILDFSKLEAQKMKLDIRTYNLLETVENSAATYKHLAYEKNIDLIVNVDQALDHNYRFDDVKLSQILGNLISNAIKYTKKGNVTINVKQLETYGFSDKILFEIIDTGTGISPDHLEDIFMSFTQLRGNLTRKVGGTGLGLAIVKRLLALFHSEIKVESELKTGSRFYFELSLKKSKKLRTHTADTNVVIKDKKILLVEDNTINALVAEKLLQTWGLDITKAQNGQIALDKSEEDKFDLILMDIHMPVLDGFAATQQLRKGQSANKYTPIVALTADIMTETNSEYHDLFDGFLTKPIEKEKLQEMLYVKLGRKTRV